MKRYTHLFLAGLVAACSDMPPVQRVPGSAPATAANTTAPAPAAPVIRPDSVPEYSGANASIESDIITVTVSDPLPAKAARLIAPDGRITQAHAIDTAREMAHEDNGLRPRVGVGAAGGSSGGVSTGIGIGFPLFSTGESKTYSVTESRISFRLADPADYRMNWQRYAIAVDLDDGVNRRTFQMLPPAPPSP